MAPLLCYSYLGHASSTITWGRGSHLLLHPRVFLLPLIRASPVFAAMVRPDRKSRATTSSICSSMEKLGIIKNILPYGVESSPLITNHPSPSKSCSENTSLNGRSATYHHEPQQAMPLIPSTNDNTCCNTHEQHVEPSALTSSIVKEEYVPQSPIQPTNRKSEKSEKSEKSSLKHKIVSTSDQKHLEFFNYDIKYLVSSKKDHRFVLKKKKRRMMREKHNPTSGKKSKVHMEIIPSAEYFDICSPGKIICDIDKSVPNSLHFEGETGCYSQPRNHVIRRGMVLLKNYLTSTQQVEIVKQCRDLGLGPGGFYRPGYKHGGKLNLQMMCLGLSWDPQTRTYSRSHPVDNSETPKIPESFYRLAIDSISFSQDIIKETEDTDAVGNTIPNLDPDICIVNFYETTGKLGLHQDRDESKESLEKGLPVVSFSIGDSADFLFGDERGVSKAENIELESGDVLIFGGESRHVFHGVSSIFPRTAPEFLYKQAHLRPGRLNLTFRQY